MKDLRGRRFGRLLVIRPTDERKNGSVVWECVCDCGNTIFTDSKGLLGNNKKSCGCLKMEIIEREGKRRAADIAGQRFGLLTAVRPTGERKKNGAIVWECVCDCGNTFFANGSTLRNGLTQSCGCLQKKSGRHTGKQMAADITGQRFGLLTAVRPTGERKNGSVIWECRCDCGNTTFTCSSNLRCGNTKSCGCMKTESIRRVGKKRAADLTGQKFGLLTVMRPTDERKNGAVVWECVCDCGNTVFTDSKRLRSGDTQSCGCLKMEIHKQVGKQRATDITGQKFNHLTAVKPTDERRGGSIVWECTCDCGKTVLASVKALKEGKKKSCGCARKKEMTEPSGKQRTTNITGQKFNHLTAVRPTDERRGGSVVWECTCDCGKTVLASVKALKEGKKKSCGCARKKKGRENTPKDQKGVQEGTSE